MAAKILFSEYLRNKRIAAGFSQADVSTELGYSTPQFVSNWERGVSLPPVNIIKTLAKKYRTSAEEMYELMENEIIKDVTQSLQQKFKEA